MTSTLPEDHTTPESGPEAPALLLLGPPNGSWLDVVRPWIDESAIEEGINWSLRLPVALDGHGTSLHAKPGLEILLDAGKSVDRAGGVYFLEPPREWLARQLDLGQEDLDASGLVGRLIDSYEQALTWATTPGRVLMLDVRQAALEPRRLSALLGAAGIGDATVRQPPMRPSALASVLADAALRANLSLQTRFNALARLIPVADRSALGELPPDNALAEAVREWAELRRPPPRTGQVAGYSLTARALPSRQALEFERRLGLQTAFSLERSEAEHAAALRRERHLRGLLEVARHEMDSLLLDRLQSMSGPGVRVSPSASMSDEVTVDIGASHPGEPHAHLEVRCHGLRCGQRPVLPALDARLVVHHGRPGLVIFEEPALLEVFGSWQVSGEESGRRFMSIVPSDVAGAEMLSRLPSSPFRMILRLVRAMASRLAGTQTLAASSWRFAAELLIDQLTRLSPRLRYDAMRIDATSKQPLTECRFVFDTVDLIGQDFERLIVVARRSLQRAQWQFALRAETGTPLPPLLSWRLRPDGSPIDEQTIPATGDGGFRQQLRDWAALSQADRAAVRAVLDALQNPAVIARDLSQKDAVAAGTLRSAVLTAMRRAAWMNAALPVLTRLRARPRAHTA